MAWLVTHTNEVYPRVCGGTSEGRSVCVTPLGLSPRVRGNQGLRQTVYKGGRSIPACAGEPSFAAAAPTASRVYPRVCGGTRKVLYTLLYRHGLSPRVRGNPSCPFVDIMQLLIYSHAQQGVM